MAALKEIEHYCNTLLSVERFKDYCPNGLQLDAGVAEVGRLACAVTASLAVIEQASAWGAQLLLVHHGYFWRGEPEPLVGVKGRRVGALYRNGLSLLAYHLPLDAHPELGNNHGLGLAMGLEGSPVGEDGLLWQGVLSHTMPTEEFSDWLGFVLQRSPLHLAGQGEAIRRIAWCTGAAQGAMERAAALGVDAFISGEVSEQTFHLARELGLHYFAAGHHATEVFGVQSLARHLQARFGLEYRFFDEPNPI